MAFVHIKHRTASGRLDEMWEFDPARGIVELVFRLANEEPASVQIRVCSPASPRRLAYPVVRLDGERWRLLACRYVENVVEVRGGVVTRLLVPEPFPIHERLTRGDHVLLCSTPADVDRELESL